MTNFQLSVACLVITLVLYFANKRLYRRFRKLPLMPLVLTPVLLVLLLVFGHISYQNYMGEAHWLLWLLGYNLSVAAAVGFIALAGVAAEFGVIMVLYLNQAIAKRRPELNDRALNEAIHEGAVLRVRPKVMTVATIMAGLLPIMWGGGTGSEVMQRIAAPMIGGMITAPLLSMLVIPAVYLLTHRNKR